MKVLADLSPQPLWQFFEELSQIPRRSKREGAAISWLLRKAVELDCNVEVKAVGTDPSIGNVLFRKPASHGCEDWDVMALQAHIDMVCEKAPESHHDFDRDPLHLRREGDEVYATDTTLGADNGIGVAAALAVLAADDLVHGPLEVLITVDEETGMSGALNLPQGWLRAQHLLNLDSEEEGVLFIGCAGGVDTVALCRGLQYEPSPSSDWICVELRVAGLKGGHSGLEINAGRANAIQLLARILQPLICYGAVRLSILHGGNQRNAIPRDASAVVFLRLEQQATLQAQIADSEAFFRRQYDQLEPGLRITWEPVADPPFMMTSGDAGKLVTLLAELPNGVQRMSDVVPGLVETSTNLGLVRREGWTVEITMLTRSSSNEDRDALCDHLGKLFRETGFEVRWGNPYPGWKADPDGPLVKRMDDAHRALQRGPLKLAAVHAGLECGIIGEKYPGMQMVSFGPNIRGAHTPTEHVSIASVARFWELLVAVLAGGSAGIRCSKGNRGA